MTKLIKYLFEVISQTASMASPWLRWYLTTFLVSLPTYYILQSGWSQRSGKVSGFSISKLNTEQWRAQLSHSCCVCCRAGFQVWLTVTLFSHNYLLASRSPTPDVLTDWETNQLSQAEKLYNSLSRPTGGSKVYVVILIFLAELAIFTLPRPIQY